MDWICVRASFMGDFPNSRIDQNRFDATRRKAHRAELQWRPIRLARPTLKHLEIQLKYKSVSQWVSQLKMLVRWLACCLSVCRFRLVGDGQQEEEAAKRQVEAAAAAAAAAATATLQSVNKRQLAMSAAVRL